MEAFEDSRPTNKTSMAFVPVISMKSYIAMKRKVAHLGLLNKWSSLGWLWQIVVCVIWDTRETSTLGEIIAMKQVNR